MIRMPLLSLVLNLKRSCKWRAYSWTHFLATSLYYNLILLYMACTSVCIQNHDIMTMLLQIHTQMNSADSKAHPDRFSHVILILPLSSRGLAPVVASQLVLEMMHQEHLFCNADFGTGNEMPRSL